MNSVRERRGPYAWNSVPLKIRWHRKRTPVPHQSPSRRKFIKKKLRITSGIYSGGVSSIPQIKKSSSWQSVLTRRVLERTRRHRPQSVPNTIDAPRRERGVSLYESNVNNRRDNAIYEGPDPPRFPISKFKEDLPAVAGVSVAHNKRMPLFWDVCVWALDSSIIAPPLHVHKHCYLSFFFLRVITIVPLEGPRRNYRVAQSLPV